MRQGRLNGEANVTARREAMARKAIGLAVETFIEAEKTLPITVNAELVVTVGTSEVQLTPLQALGFAEQLARASFRRVIAEEILAAAPSGFGADAFGLSSYGSPRPQRQPAPPERNARDDPAP